MTRHELMEELWSAMVDVQEADCTMTHLAYACVDRLMQLGISPALAAATGTAKTPKAVECEASQSGPKGNAQPLSPNSFEEQ